MSDFLEKIEAFLKASEMPQSNFGFAAVRDPNLVRRLRAGGDIRLKTAMRIDAFILGYWNDKTDLQTTRCDDDAHSSDEPSSREKSEIYGVVE
ncbi:hypothetical protein [Roseibium sp.]|uniref:hypothetical protein n=1 Tax=Roseibium sp. TaxID=1936156 RepID=UPI00329A7C77